MNLDNISFPYPVLGCNDDICPIPELPEASIEVDQNYYHFKVKLKYDNQDIRRLISCGFADHVCEVVCSSTKYRRCFTSDDGVFDIVIPRRSLGGRIVFSPTVTVKEPISNYTNVGFHPDYEGHRFDMEPGDILAVFNQLSYNADIRYDKLKAVGSFMVIEETPDVLPNTLLDRDKIRLLLPSALYNQYRTNPKVNSNPDIIHASLVLNSLIYALCRFELYSHKRWAEAIKYRIETEEELSEFRETDPAEWRVDRLAQIFLGKPYERLFNALSNQNVGE